VITVV